MIALDPAARRRIIATARLLESDKDGERNAAMEALLRLLPRDVTLADLLERALPAVVEFRSEPSCDWRLMAAHADLRRDLSLKERRFVRNLMSAKFPPSEKQMSWLVDILNRERCAA